MMVIGLPSIHTPFSLLPKTFGAPESVGRLPINARLYSRLSASYKVHGACAGYF